MEVIREYDGTCSSTEYPRNTSISLPEGKVMFEEKVTSEVDDLGTQTGEHRFRKEIGGEVVYHITRPSGFYVPPKFKDKHKNQPWSKQYRHNKHKYF